MISGTLILSSLDLCIDVIEITEQIRVTSRHKNGNSGVPEKQICSSVAYQTIYLTYIWLENIKINMQDWLDPWTWTIYIELLD